MYSQIKPIIQTKTKSNKIISNSHDNKIFIKKSLKNIFCFYFIISIIMTQIFTKKTRQLISNSNKITIIIEGKECNHILNLNKIDEPDKIIINGKEIFNSTCLNDEDNNKYKINLGKEKEKNKVELIWDKYQFKTIDNLFEGISNIIEVDFSEFNSVNITSAQSLFKNCKSLLSINFSGKFNTSNINNMNEIFSSCSSLKILDLSNFDTSNVKNMKNMFKDCISLKILNIPKLINNNVENIDNIFKGCSKLEYLNLFNSDFTNIKILDNIFSELNNTVICIYTNDIYLIKEITKKENIEINCNKTWDEYLKDFIEVKAENNLINTNEILFDINYNCSIEDFFYGICTMIFFDDEQRYDFIEKIINKIQNKEIMSLIKEITEENKILIGSENNNKNIYQLLTIDNQIFLENNTIISFGSCEQELKSDNPNQKLILFKTEFYYEGYKIPIIYYKIFTENDLDELDINACKEMPQYLIPVIINEKELYKYDLNNDYYKNICSTYTSENKTDITLYDRKNDQGGYAGRTFSAGNLYTGTGSSGRGNVQYTVSSFGQLYQAAAARPDWIFDHCTAGTTLESSSGRRKVFTGT